MCSYETTYHCILNPLIALASTMFSLLLWLHTLTGSLDLFKLLLIRAVTSDVCLRVHDLRSPLDLDLRELFRSLNHRNACYPDGHLVNRAPSNVLNEVSVGRKAILRYIYVVSLVL